ncbi:hypothetical protein NK553_24075 [Pseudomonas sp. ZM23]|uniref:Uncharacterized protein n=1 Tax=Pseudomonas triclosanedens TaxID=2961893 RepID=A0ABY6ZS94_9PSED|nr:hypothetical protein [Pseudomonas triclosanedens]MCP8467035.1 hypothetical protein [Pseudomonas triclosanedens]MCP8472817.1 hypothetical protein [Pseudomonas triclosanedens]MCP8478248.1 hypothetical protein [Pseudomonas triclosanedens]WAI47654.1 hypothetical protein OU419_17935 [Pseudomonas triclosanedens]
MTSNDQAPAPNRALDSDQARRFIDALQGLSDQHGLGMDRAGLDTAGEACCSAAFYVGALFPQCSINHTIEQGEAPGSLYPNMLNAYASLTAGEFVPSAIEADTEDDWESLTLAFRVNGKARRFSFDGAEGSDYFTSRFVMALNDFAKRQGLAGRWVDFHDGNDGCTSVYIPAEAQAALEALRRECFAEEDADEPVKVRRRPPARRPEQVVADVAPVKAPLAQRKADWQGVLQRLKGDADFDKTQFKLLERYYVSGEEPDWAPGERGEDPIPLVYRLWLHPDQSEASWQAIAGRVLSYGFARPIEQSMWQSAQALFRADGGWNGRDRPLGKFAGAEERLYRFLHGLTTPEGGFPFREAALRMSERGLARYCDDLKYWLEAPAQRGPSVNLHRLAEWVDYLESAGFKASMDAVARPVHIQVFLKRIGRHPLPAPGTEPDECQRYCASVREALEGRDLHPTFAKWWTMAQAG